MIVCFSASSPISSVALVSSHGELLFGDQRETSQNASGACMEMLDRGLREISRALTDATVICADVGPGSFIGTRVGVTLAKSLAFVLGLNAAGATSFDLIDPSQTVVLPSKRGEFFVRRPGEEPFRTSDLPENVFMGYGPGIETQIVPNAARFASLLQQIEPVEPVRLMPCYLIEPSISTPRRPFTSRVAKGK